jgi:hypothetical protein
MRVDIDARLPASDDVGFLKTRLSDIHRQVAAQLNNLSEGYLAGKYAALTAAPTTGTWAQGDEVTNSEPSELGAGGSKYIIDKWRCVTGGTPGIWVEVRGLTGN